MRPDESADLVFPGYAATATRSFTDHRDTPGDTPAALLWFALCIAPDDGASIAELMSSSGMNRTTLYRHLIDHAQAGRAVQVSRGRWRAATPGQTDANR